MLILATTKKLKGGHFFKWKPLCLLRTSPTSAVSPTSLSASFKLNWKDEKTMDPGSITSSKSLKASPMSKHQNTHQGLWDLNTLSSEHCCFLLTCYHNWWDSLFLWKTVQYRWSCQGYPVTHHFCPACSWRMRTEHSAPYISTTGVNSGQWVWASRSAVTDVTQAQMPRRWGSDPLRLYFPTALVVPV